MQITTFDGGIPKDIRNGQPNQFAICHHFDTFSKRNKLIPYRDMEDEAGSLSAYNIGSVELNTDSAGAQSLFALGNVSGQTFPQILEKATNFVTGTFGLATTGAAIAGTVIKNSLKSYQNKLYCMKTSGSTTIVDSYNPATDAYTSTVGTISSISSTGVYPEPFIHPQDATIYFGAGNVVATLHNSTFTAAALTLPTGWVITSFEDYGIYLAITIAPIDQGNASFTILWGRDTSIVEVDENQSNGECSTMIVGNLSGKLVTISAQSQAAGSTLDIAPKIVFHVYSGGSMEEITDIQWQGTGTPTTLLKNFKAKKNNKLYFAAKQYIENKTVNQIWVCGFNEAGQFFVTPDKLVNNDTALTGNVDGFSMIGDYTWVAYNADGSLKRTNDTASYTATSIYESLAFAGTSPFNTDADIGDQKNLQSVTVNYEPLPSGGQIVCKARLDQTTTWTTLFTRTTLNEMSYTIKHGAGTFPAGFHKECHIRIESTGGAVPLGFDFSAPKTNKK